VGVMTKVAVVVISIMLLYVIPVEKEDTSQENAQTLLTTQKVEEVVVAEVVVAEVVEVGVVEEVEEVAVVVEVEVEVVDKNAIIAVALVIFHGNALPNYG